MPNNQIPPTPPPGFAPVQTVPAPPPGFAPVASPDSDVVTIDGQPVNLRTGVGAEQAAGSQMAAQATPVDLRPEPPKTTEKAFVPAMGGGYIAVDVPLGEAEKYEAAHLKGYQQGAKQGLTAIGAALAPELLPEMEGGGLLGYLGRAFLRSGASGIGAGIGNAAGQTATGQNPLSKESLHDTGRVAGTTAALSVPLEFIGQIPSTKLGRSAINQSLGAQTRDITYGNPAKALVDEGINDVSSGDYEAFKSALRAGKSPAEAAQKAGGRFAAVNQRISEYAPRLEKLLSSSNARIPVADAIDKPLNDAALEVIHNPAMTDAEKDTAINQLGALQKAAKQGLGTYATPSQLNMIKQAVGNRVNWGGNVAVTDEIKPAYRGLYGSLKNAINKAVPEASEINERLSNLLAARNDLEVLTKAEEVGRGGGLTGGKIGSSVVGVAEREAGRVLPSAAKLAKPALKAAVSQVPTVVGSENKDNR